MKRDSSSSPVIALVDRGDCFFIEKASNAEKAGAAALPTNGIGGGSRGGPGMPGTGSFPESFGSRESWAGPLGFLRSGSEV